MVSEGTKIEKIGKFGTIAHAWRIGNKGFDRVIIDSGFYVDVNLWVVHRYVNPKGFY